MLCCFDWSGNQGKEETVLGGALMMELCGFSLM